MKNFLESSRYIVLVGIVGTFVASLTLFLFGLGGILVAVWDALSAIDPFSYEHLKEISIILIQAIDIFLLARMPSPDGLPGQRFVLLASALPVPLSL